MDVLVSLLGEVDYLGLQLGLLLGVPFTEGGGVAQTEEEEWEEWCNWD